MSGKRGEDKRFADLLRGHRVAAGLSQEQLAERAGLGVRTIGDLERGRVMRPQGQSIMLLATALGLSPAARDELARAGLRLPTQPAPAGGHVPRQLPPAVPHFAGRADALRALTDLSAAAADGGMVVISAIDGTAGIGKTALAVHWAHQVADRFPDGQLYVNLRGFDPAGAPVAPAEALGGFLDALGVPPAQIPAGLDAQAARYRSLLAGRRMLVLLDNARDAEQVRPLLPGSPGCLVVVTSRAQLLSLVAAQGAHPLTLDLLSVAEARELLTRRLGTGRVSREPHAVDELIDLCARLPLALNIVAARAAGQPAQSLAGLADQLRDARRRLDLLNTGDPVTDVRAVFSWSSRNLSPHAARMFRLIGGVSPGPDTSAPAAASLAGLPLELARQALDELTTARLLTEQPPGRYSFHDLLREHAAELSKDTELTQQTGNPDDGRAALSRLLSWYLHTADAAAIVLAPQIQRLPLPAAEPDVRPLEFRTYDEAMEWCDTERVNLVAAVNQAACSGMHGYAWRLPLVLRRFFRLGKHWADWIATYQIALTSAELDRNRMGLGWILNSFGEPYTDLGQLTTAVTYRQKAAALQHEIGDRQGEAATLNNLGANHAMLGQLEEALTYLMRALEILREIGKRYYESIVLENIGVNMRRRGRYNEAISYLRQALTIYRDNGDRYNQASALRSLGELHLDLEQHADAARCYQQALQHCRSLHDRGGEAEALDGLGNAQLGLDCPDAARRSWLQARRIFAAIGDPRERQVDTSLSSLNAPRPA